MSLKAVKEWLDDPESDRVVHGRLFVFWILMVVPSALFWKESVTYLVAVSLYALIVGHWSSWQAAKAEDNVMKCLRAVEAQNEEILQLLREAA